MRPDGSLGEAVAARALRPACRDNGHGIAVAGAHLVADLSGALYWPDERALAVADLHLEKGSAFAARGMLLPPYDTADTLERLAWVIARYAPRLVVALGDSFHDRAGAMRLGSDDRAALAALQRGRDWMWIAGNHDPEPSVLPGAVRADIPLRSPHLPPRADRGRRSGEIAGHLHPAAQVSRRGRSLMRRCFVGDGRRLVMPAFGAYAGGLNIRDRAFLAVFGGALLHRASDRRPPSVRGAGGALPRLKRPCLSPCGTRSRRASRSSAPSRR